eukprot:6855092-Prymnesium_polylepis.1
MPGDLDHGSKGFVGSSEGVAEEGMRLHLADDVLRTVAYVLMHIVEEALRASQRRARSAAPASRSSLDLAEQSKRTNVPKVGQPTLTRPEGVVRPRRLPNGDVGLPTKV